MNTETKISVIPATRPKFLSKAPVDKKRRVAGYARVSTDSKEQQTSYEAQVDYYTNFIQSKPEWEFAGLYTDEGISATNTKKRDGFNLMVADALAGKIDLIITKSVSRFARNTVDSLVAVRKLKEKGVEVYFEKENIFTLDSKGELMITIMSSLAQEESRSISENVAWGQRKRIADGKVCMPYKQFLGYQKGEDGFPVVNRQEAEIVKKIYSLFLTGKTVGGIAKQLEKEGIPSPGGKTKWAFTTVQSILTNEKYKGDARLQKSFTVDFLTKKKKVNEGELPQYYVENSHEAIIDRDTFERVQLEFERRKQFRRQYSGNNVFTSKLVCGDCGGLYGAKVWHSNDPNRKVIFQCNRKFTNDKKCCTPHFSEEEIKERFLRAFNRLLEQRDDVISNCREAIELFCSTAESNTRFTEAQSEVAVVAELINKAVKENASVALNQSEYEIRYKGLTDRYDKAMRQVNDLQAEIYEKNKKRESMELFIKTLEKQEMILDTFDEQLWIALLDTATVKENGQIEFKFMSGISITE